MNENRPISLTPGSELKRREDEKQSEQPEKADTKEEQGGE